MLRRPIIVFADTQQQGQPCFFRGIYLPYEWSGHLTWERAPILLAYCGNHFVPLTYHLGVNHLAEGGVPIGTEARAWPLLPLSTSVHGQAQALPIVFVPELSEACRSDAVSALARFLPVVRDTTTDEVGLRLDLNALCQDANARAQAEAQAGDSDDVEVHGLVRQMLCRWLHEAESFARVSTSPVGGGGGGQGGAAAGAGDRGGRGSGLGVRRLQEPNPLQQNVSSTPPPPSQVLAGPHDTTVYSIA